MKERQFSDVARVLNPNDVAAAVRVLPEPVTLSPLPPLVELCSGCKYEEVCRKDNTCWRRVAAEGWTRTVNRVKSDRGQKRWTAETALAAIRRYSDEHGHAPTEHLLRSHADLPGSGVLTHYFGSLTNAWREAGVTPAPRARPFSRRLA